MSPFSWVFGLCRRRSAEAGNVVDAVPVGLRGPKDVDRTAVLSGMHDAPGAEIASSVVEAEHVPELMGDDVGALEIVVPRVRPVGVHLGRVVERPLGEPDVAVTTVPVADDRVPNLDVVGGARDVGVAGVGEEPVRVLDRRVVGGVDLNRDIRPVGECAAGLGCAVDQRHVQPDAVVGNEVPVLGRVVDVELPPHVFPEVGVSRV